VNVHLCREEVVRLLTRMRAELDILHAGARAADAAANAA
jgi:hypothetical protein